ncbi:MAG: nucleotidyltransferase family protein [bacterium]
MIQEELTKENLKLIDIILFGSRAKEKFNENSDNDLLLIIDKELDFKNLINLKVNIRRKLIKFDIVADIFINSFNYFNKYKTDKDRILYYALKEGITI